MMVSVNEVSIDKTKLPTDFFFRIVSLVCCTAELQDAIIIHNRCTCKLIIKTTAVYVYANEQLRLCFFFFFFFFFFGFYSLFCSP